MGFGLFGLLFFLVFLAVAGTMLASLIRNIGQWNKNNHSPG